MEDAPPEEVDATYYLEQVTLDDDDDDGYEYKEVEVDEDLEEDLDAPDDEDLEHTWSRR